MSDSDSSSDYVPRKRARVVSESSEEEPEEKKARYESDEDDDSDEEAPTLHDLLALVEPPHVPMRDRGLKFGAKSVYVPGPPGDSDEEGECCLDEESDEEDDEEDSDDEAFIDDTEYSD